LAEWIYFIHPPREQFAETMTEAEEEVWGRHWERIQKLYAEGSIILVGPIMDGDPTIAEGFATGELRPFRVSLLRGGS
jgi:hypothetical protein